MHKKNKAYYLIIVYNIMWDALISINDVAITILSLSIYLNHMIVSFKKIFHIVNSF